MRGWRLFVFVAVAAGFLWTMRTSPPPRPLQPLPQPDPPAELGTAFDPAKCGSLICRVAWAGDEPAARPISLFQSRVRPGGKTVLPNPNAPRISQANGLADVVVRVQGIDPARSRPWDHPPVTVEADATDMTVRAGETRGRFGIVRRGEPVQFIAHDAAMHSVRGRGADFFTLMLFTPDQPVSRQMSRIGIVELSSGTWYYWLRAYLVVTDHPYIGVTGSDGQVKLDQLPDGEYEVTCWKANWHIEKLERDPEWVLHTGLKFHPPAERRQRVRITAGQPARLTFTFSDSDFAPCDRQGVGKN